MLDLFFNPSGRIGRAPWWYVRLFNVFVIVISAFALLDGIAERNGFWLLISLMLCAVVCWSDICASIKRYHDLGKSGWWMLIAVIPVLGPIWNFVECGFVGGELRDNAYGPGPRINIDEDLEGLPDAPVRDQNYPARNFTPLPVASSPLRDANHSLKPSFGKRG
jgi:uncharacterized membrane protein YhaH (DUF805 family)